MVEVTQADRLLPCPKCQKDKAAWGGLSYYAKDGKVHRHDAIRCLHCHYWFYVGADKNLTAKRWNTRQSTADLQAKLDMAVEALKEMVPLLKATDNLMANGFVCDAVDIAIAAIHGAKT